MRLLFSILLLALSLNLFADCSYGFSKVFPTDTLSQGGFFVLEGGYHITPLFKNDGVNHLYFVNETDTIKAIIQNQYKGGLNKQHQSFLKAEKALIGEKYKLMVITDSIQEFYRVFNKQTNELDPVEWVINHSMDNSTPIFEESPVILRQNCAWFGCGPARDTYFECVISDQSYSFIEVQVRTLPHEVWDTFYVELIFNSSNMYSKNQVFSVGHNMCYGSFGYLNGTEFEARFRLIDLYGNVSESFSPLVYFSTPTQENSKRN